MAELKQLILDVRKPQGQIVTVYGRQGDTNIQRELVIQDGGDPYDMEGKHIVFECMRPDGCFVSTSEGIGENKGNATFDVTIPVQATAVAGLVGLCFYKIVKDDGTPFRDTTATFELSLERDVDTNAEPGNYDDKLQEAQNTITDLLKKWEEQQQTQESDYAEALKKLKEDIDAAVKATESEARETFTAAEADRQQTFEAAEATRNNAETERAKAETAREEASKQAVDAAEAATTAATDAASTATTAAADANAAAAAANDAADEAEAALASINNTQAAIDDKEAERQANEQTRISNEEGRVAAEAAREEEHAKHNEQQAANNAAQTANDEAQAANDTAQAKNNADQAANNLAAQGRLTKILKEGEYDPETRVPTIEGDLTHVFAVPTAEAEAARILLDKAEATYKTAMADAGGEGPQFDGQITVAQTALEEARTAYEASNKYVEWLWILDEETGEGSWELYGNGNTTLPDPITTDEIDKMWAGEPVETKHFQQSAGTAYNISKTKEAIAGAKTELNGTIDEVSQSLGALTTTVMNNQKAAVEKDSAQDEAIKKAQDAADAVDADLDRALEAQTTRDADQDTAIEEAKAAADAAAKAIPPTVSKTAPGVVPALPADASSDKLYAMGADAEGVGQWYEVKATGGGLDPRELRETIAAATKIHDEAHSDTQADPLLHSWQNTQEAITALQAAIDKAKAVSDGCFQTVFTQAEVDAAKRELDQALETFKRTGTEALPNYEAYEALKKRVEEVNTSTTSSADGKDVPFGSKYVLVSDKATVDKALQTAEANINAATKQSQIDAAVSTLGTAVTAYEGAVKTATANTAALDQAIADAEAAKKDVAVSIDGSDLPAGSRYVEDQATLDALTQAITAATEAKSSATTQAQIDSATSTLTAATKEFNGKVKQNVSIYGVRFDNFPATTKGIRTDAAASFGDIKPALNNGTGSSPFDNIAPWSEMQPEDRPGGRMVKIPRFWYKLEQNAKGINVQIATGPMEGFTISPAHMDRHDGKGEREAVYVGRYHCATGTYKSTTKVLPANNANKATMIQNCEKVGDGYHMMDWATRFTLWLLYLVEAAEWNTQQLIGYGCGNNSSVENMGYTDAMQYHTGTSQAATTTKAIGTQYRNIEGLWDNVYDILSGCYYDSKGLNVLTDTSKLGDTSGGNLVGLPVAGYPGELKVSEGGGYPSFYPSAAGGSATTGTCDYWNFGASNPVVCVGGNYSQVDNRGLFYVSFTAATNTDANRGCRLLELP